MEVTKEKTSSITYIPSEHDKYIEEAMHLLKNTIERSVENLDKHHILDSFCQKVSKLIKNPLGAMLENIEENEQRISKILDFIVQSEFESNKGIIKSVYKFDNSPSNVLLYCIVFNNEDENNRYKLNKFLLDYEQSDFDPRFKIIFQYIPQEMESDLKDCTKLSLPNVDASTIS